MREVAAETVAVVARRFVWSQLGDHILDLSRNKCASNVIEKCLATGDRAEVDTWVSALCAKHDRLAELMKDQFGNYVCFTAFLVRPALPVKGLPLLPSHDAGLHLRRHALFCLADHPCPAIWSSQ